MIFSSKGILPSLTSYHSRVRHGGYIACRNSSQCFSPRRHRAGRREEGHWQATRSFWCQRWRIRWKWGEDFPSQLVSPPLSAHPTKDPDSSSFRNVIGGVAGLSADANSLVNFARSVAQQHLLAYNEDIPVEILAQRLCDMKQGYTQFGGETLIDPVFPPLTHGQASVRLVYHCCTQATTHITNSNSINPIPLATTLAGRLRASVPTTEPRRVCSSKSTRTTLR